MAKHTRAAMATPADLPKLIGYAEIEDWYDIDKRTIQRRMREGKWPRPMEGSGKNFWYLDDVLAALDGMRRGLIAAAVCDPSKVKPEQLSDATFELAAKLTGVPKDQLAIGQRLEGDTELDGFGRAMLPAMAALDRLDHRQAAIVVYGLVPALRPLMTELLRSMGAAGPAPSEHAAISAALALMHDALANPKQA